ncbi:hypothetical protein Tco_1184348 [Tanacetum coccineum]
MERGCTIRLELPQELSRVHHTFHVSNLNKCYADEPLVMPLEGIHIDDKLQFVEEPVEIMEREIKRLKRSRIPLVKIINILCYPDWGVYILYLEPRYREPAVDVFSTSTITYHFRLHRHDPGRVNFGEPRGYTDEVHPFKTSSTDYKVLPIQPHEFPAKEQPVPPVVSPTAKSPGYVVESDSEEDPKEYEDAETEDGPVDCLMDGGDDGDDDDGDSSGDGRMMRKRIYTTTLH